MSLADRLIWHIEMKMNQTVTLDSLAQSCGASPYHLSRAFRSATGFSPMAYLRARRLSVAAQSLALGDEDILTIALSAQYGSHEAFTRAFAACFGWLPSTVRAARSTNNLDLMEPMEMKKEMLVDVAPPEFRHHDVFRVVGLGIQCTFEDIGEIPGLWQQFNARANEAPFAGADVAYGVCGAADAAGRFRYVAGVEMNNGITPKGMESVEFPAGRYAVFTHSGHVADLPKTVYLIWNKLLPDLELEPRKAPDFELYDKRFDPRTGRGVVEIWLPVE